ncbi:dihydroorotate oxidase A [Plasticicumulans lactativorans]|uniref:Dihydroorotate dehydrogenase (quinone) n=1 Tax=Plasticicumulans lactativorans TaxID=1133106 RepID=A0A4R2LTD9_9GAMM|nr:quinone-dependent dihydroorotate dehydrogenase [Plasticicumulans lactativorans]TCO83052.1 dihydroorotate oxidase A [Plasticicumulans lactativorans]
MLYELVRSALFRLDAETAHDLALAALARLGEGTRRLAGAVPRRPRVVMGIEFPNPVGLAAGLDKNGAAIAGLAALGFGFIEIGTVTPRPQPGNPRPRLFRLPQAEALINRFGFNNRGVDHLVERVRTAGYRGVLGINIGKNKDTPNEHALDDYLACLRKVYAHAGYVTVNISSPNTPGLRDLQYGESLDQLLMALKAEQARLADTHGRYVPLALKIAPDLADADIPVVAAALARAGIDAVIATNTTLDRRAVAGLPHADEAGGLSGAPLVTRSTEVIRRLATALDGRLPIIGVGGILSGADARAKIDAGASLVQLYTGLIYRGPALIREAVDAIG